MEKAALFGSLLLISLNAKSQINQEWATWGMKGHVKSTEEKLYKSTGQGNQEKLWTVTSRNYNTAGKIVDEIKEDVENKFGHKTSYQYDDKARLKSYDYRQNPSGTLELAYLCSYSSDGMQMKINEKAEDDKIWRTEIRKYNSSGKEIERSCSYTGAGKPEKTRFIYDAKGVKIEEIRDFTDGSDGSTKPEKEEFIIDSTGNLIQVNGFCDNGINIVDKWVYLSFDTKGNWTKCIYSFRSAYKSVDINTVGNDFVFTITRKIEYY